ncbi:MAG: TVP38/TMEM64 family protein [Mycobacteriaceae bacterium]
MLLRLGVALLMVGAAVTAAVLISTPSVTHLRTQFDHPSLFSALMFAALYAAITVSPLPKAVFTIAAGAVFGVPAAIPIVLAGALAGAVIAFYLGRLLGREATQRLAGRGLATLDTQLRRHGLWAITALRLVPVVPFTAVNYLSGLTALRLAPYAVGSLLGMTPATTAYAFVGAYGSSPGSWPFLAALAGLVTLASIGALLAAQHHRNTGRTASTDDNTAAGAAPEGGQG